MRFTLADYGKVFSTRPRGAELLAVVESQAPRGVVVEIDFEGVQSVSYSFVDEFLGALVERASRPNAFDVAVINAPTRFQRVIDGSLASRGLDDALLAA